MPLPLFLGAAAAAAAAAGVGKGAHSVAQNKKAKELNSHAQNLYEEAKTKAEKARKASSNSLESLGRKKLNILDGNISTFVETFSQIKNVELENSVGLDELKVFSLDEQSIAEMKELGTMATSMLGGLAGGTLGGALTAFGAYNAAMALGAASTGTAIATLSGAAATNATLAFFGGGAIASGGLGIAGGSMVLGGLVAGPALAVLGFALDAKASANLDKAYANLAEAKKIEEELLIVTDLCTGIAQRSKMFYKLLSKLDNLLTPLNSTMSYIVETEGTDFSKYNQTAKEKIAMSASVASAIKSILDTPILTSDGELTEESKESAEKVTSFIADVNKQNNTK
ncbi:hypothetical protein JZO70_00090 [Enterococcus sp. 669A]|uniref:Uncharacterized protein n=1 Tax=Candidatus Enterococcus moelleringii TaxID=2815325 RepID=A0ABS3L4I8_9ENTE|nr:hypothetical protein [Enterococcus sp. 669A]MBO1304541.1 hypothetical protein [Enterococcus sp. 669A]